MFKQRNEGQKKQYTNINTHTLQNSPLSAIDWNIGEKVHSVRLMALQQLTICMSWILYVQRHIGLCICSQVARVYAPQVYMRQQHRSLVVVCGLHRKRSTIIGLVD